MSARTIARRSVVMSLLLIWQHIPAHAQGYGYGGHRSVIGRTLSDLRRASRFARGGREHERIDNAQRHLSEFDRMLSRGRYDQGRLNEAIEDVHNVVRNNYMPPRQRDILADDLQRLRALRARENRYGGLWCGQ